MALQRIEGRHFTIEPHSEWLARSCWRHTASSSAQFHCRSSRPCCSQDAALPRRRPPDTPQYAISGSPTGRVPVHEASPAALTPVVTLSRSVVHPRIISRSGDTRRKQSARRHRHEPVSRDGSGVGQHGEPDSWSEHRVVALHASGDRSDTVMSLGLVVRLFPSPPLHLEHRGSI